MAKWRADCGSRSVVVEIDHFYFARELACVFFQADHCDVVLTPIEEQEEGEEHVVLGS